MKTQINIRPLHLPLALCLLVIMTGPMSVQATSEGNESAAVNLASEQLPIKSTTADDSVSNDFTYQLEGRLDPFSPFITEKATSKLNMDDIVSSDEPLTGMQLFEPGQLKLVAIVFEDQAELAMVEDAKGQGYTLRPGMKIGKTGVITTITPNQVNIEETSVTRSGKKLTNTIVMLLKKEGEE